MKTTFARKFVEFATAGAALATILAPAAAATPAVSDGVYSNNATLSQTFNSATNESGNGKIIAVDWHKDARKFSKDNAHIPTCYRQNYPGDRPPDWNSTKYPPYRTADNKIAITPQSFQIPCGQFGW